MKAILCLFLLISLVNSYIIEGKIDSKFNSENKLIFILLDKNIGTLRYEQI